MSLQDIYADYQAGRLQAGENKLTSFMLKNPGNAQALQLGAMLAARAGNLPTAFDRIRASLRDPTNAHEKLNTQANILRGLGADIDARRSWEAALQVAPGFHLARYNLAAFLQKTGHPEAALAQYEALLEVDAKNPLAHRGRVQALIDLNRADDALAALEGSPMPTAEVAALKARALFVLDRFEDAIGSNARAYGDAQYGSEALKLSLQILSMTGAWDGMARPLIDDVLGSHSDSDALHSAALHALQRAGETEAAAELYDRAPKGPATLAKRAEWMAEQADYAEAERLARAALDLANGFPPALYQLCNASLGLGKFDQAQQVADIALKSDPNGQFWYAIKATAGRAKGQDYRYYFDYDSFVKPYDIEVPEGWKSLAAYNADLKAELESLHGFTSEPLDQTLRLGTQTSPNLRFVESPAIKAYFEAVRPAIADYIEGLGRDPQHAFLRRNIGGFRIRSGWSIRLQGGGHHVNHVHPDGWISSAYYVEVPKGEDKAGWIKFGEPPAPLSETLGQGPELDVKPKPGRLVLFPSYLWHGTYPTAKGTTRMTLPIDIVPALPNA